MEEVYKNRIKAQNKIIGELSRLILRLNEKQKGSKK